MPIEGYRRWKNMGKKVCVSSGFRCVILKRVDADADADDILQDI